MSFHSILTKFISLCSKWIRKFAFLEIDLFEFLFWKIISFLEAALFKSAILLSSPLVWISCFSAKTKFSFVCQIHGIFYQHRMNFSNFMRNFTDNWKKPFSLRLPSNDALVIFSFKFDGFWESFAFDCNKEKVITFNNMRYTKYLWFRSY